MRFVGSNEELAFFEKNGQYAAIYLDTNLVANLTEYDLAKKLEELPERPSTKVFSDSTLELANSALTFLDPVVAAGDRMYTIPDGVISEAKKALEWRKEHKRGGTPVGLNTARTLAKGGQIGIRKVRHIAKYFPRHEVDKKGKGWDAGEDGYPSNGKIAWALWGGDAAWRWSRAIVEREDNKARTAGGYALPGYEDDLETYGYDGYDADISPFKLAHDLDSSVGPEFMARVRMDGSGVDRLYKIEIDGTVAIWDDCGWDDLGHVDGDVYFYDKALDDEYDSTPCEHVLIDPSSAVVISAFMQERPFQPVRLEEIDPEEAGLVAEGLQDEDFGMIDRVMSIAQEPIKAAGQVDAPSKSKADKDGDGVLDSDFLSKKAESQPRDASGLFVKVGSRVVVGGDRERGSGVLDSIDYENNKVNVKLDSGKTIAVSSKYTEGEDRAKEKAGPMQVPTNMPPLDLSGIIGKPRTPINQPLARVPGTMRALTDKAVGEMLTDWSAAVKKDRESYIPLDAADKAKVERRYGELPEKTGTTPEKSTLPDKAGATPGKVTLSGKSEGTKSTLLEKAGSTPSKSTLPEKAGNTPGTVNLSGKTSAEKSETESKASQKTAAPDSSKKSSTPVDSKKKSTSDSGTSSFDEDGKYITQKGDSLWSIAEKTKGDDQTTEDQWLKILEANKENLRSDDPNLIFPDERINVPGQGKSKPSDNRAPIQPKKSKTESAQEKIRKAKQDEQRAADAKSKADAKARADVQGKISKVKQDEARAAKPNVQEAMRKDKQALSKAEADKKKQADAQEKIRNARNADRLDTTERAKEANRQKTQEAMRQDKKAISDAEAAKNKASDTQEKLRNARNADRLDTTRKGKEKADQQTKDAMRNDKKQVSEAEAAKAKSQDAQERLRNARNADRIATTAKEKAESAQRVRDIMAGEKSDMSKAEAAKEKADKSRDTTREARNADRLDTTRKAQDARQQKTQEAMRQDKQGQSAVEAKKAVADSAREGVRQEKSKESPGISKTVSDKAAAKTQEQLRQAKMGDTKVVKQTMVEKTRAKARAAREALLKARASNDTYQKRVAEAQKRVDENNRKRGNN